MHELILKDFHIHKNYLLMTGPFYVLYMGILSIWVRNATFYAIFGSILFSVFVMTFPAREERFKAIGFGLSLPATRRKTVLARFLMSWALMLALYVIGAGLCEIIPGGKLSIEACFQGKIILSALAAMTLFFGTIFPFTIRYGMAGILAFLVFFQVLGIAAMSLRFLIGRHIFRVAAGIKTAFVAVHVALGPAAFALLLVIVLVMLNVISFEISVAIMKRKEY